jgi:signal transduction histidine kinase
MLRIQWKIILLVALVIVGMLSAVVWKTRAVVVKDRLSFMADSAMKQVAPLKRLVQDRMEEEKSKLVKFAATRANMGAGRVRGFGGFEIIALVEPQQGAQWTAAWIEKSTTARPEIWPAGYELTLLKSLPYTKVRDGETVWTRLSDRQGSPIYATIISVEIQTTAPALGNTNTNPLDAALPDSTDYAAGAAGSGRKAVVVGFSTFDPLAEVTEDYIGSTSNVFLVDDKGYVASHVNKAYLGALFSEDPIVKEIIATKKTAASGNYEDLENRSVLGHFERIDHTNLYAVITSPLQSARDLSNSVVSSALTAGSAVGLLGLILAFLLGRGISQPIGDAVTAIRALNRGEAFILQAPDTNDELGALMRLIAESSPAALASKANWSQQRQVPPSGSDTNSSVSSLITLDGSSTGSSGSSEAKAILVGSDSVSARGEQAAFEAFSAGFTKAIKEPLLAILGHAQLAKAKTEASEMRGHAESIEREARRATDVLERLHNWKAEVVSVAEGENVDLNNVVESVLARVGDELKADEIDVKLDLHSVPQIHGSLEQMQVAIGNVIENAREAMRARAERTLRIQLDFLRDSVYLVITDTGVGMSRDVKERAFEPFFKGFESPKRLGLGLTLVQTALRSVGGACEIESTPGEGSSFTLKFPVASAEKQVFLGAQNLKIADVVAEKFDTPSPIALPQFMSMPATSADSVESSMSPPPLPARDEPPAGASAADILFDDPEDENDDIFASVDLNQKAKQAVITAKVAEQVDPQVDPPAEAKSEINLESDLLASTDSGERGQFRVKIRKPRLRS